MKEWIEIKQKKFIIHLLLSKTISSTVNKSFSGIIYFQKSIWQWANVIF